MCRKLFFLLNCIMLLSLAGNLQAEPFSIGAVEDITLDNGPRYGPDTGANGTGLEARDIPDRRHVFLISYDISSLKGSGQFANVSFSHYSYNLNGEALEQKAAQAKASLGLGYIFNDQWMGEFAYKIRLARNTLTDEVSRSDILFQLVVRYYL